MYFRRKGAVIHRVKGRALYGMRHLSGVHTESQVRDSIPQSLSHSVHYLAVDMPLVYKKKLSIGLNESHYVIGIIWRLV